MLCFSIFSLILFASSNLDVFYFFQCSSCEPPSSVVKAFTYPILASLAEKWLTEIFSPTSWMSLLRFISLLLVSAPAMTSGWEQAFSQCIGLKYQSEVKKTFFQIMKLIFYSGHLCLWKINMNSIKLSLKSHQLISLWKIFLICTPTNAWLYLNRFRDHGIAILVNLCKVQKKLGVI